MERRDDVFLAKARSIDISPVWRPDEHPLIPASFYPNSCRLQPPYYLEKSRYFYHLPSSVPPPPSPPLLPGIVVLNATCTCCRQIPKPKAKTRWEKFAELKVPFTFTDNHARNVSLASCLLTLPAVSLAPVQGIQKHKRSRKVWDVEAKVRPP